MRILLEKLAELTVSERRFIARAWLAAPAVELGLATLGLRRTLNAIERLTPPRTSATPPTISAERGAQLVAASFRRHVVKGTCLPQALVQYALHRQAGHEVTLVVGVRPPGSSSLEAHAWVEDGAAATSRDEGYEPILTRESQRRTAA